MRYKRDVSIFPYLKTSLHHICLIDKYITNDFIHMYGILTGVIFFSDIKVFYSVWELIRIYIFLESLTFDDFQIPTSTSSHIINIS